MNIEEQIISWVNQEINSAKLQGMEPKQMRKGITIAFKELKKIASKEIDYQQKRYEEKQ